jgi:hypothetical protein
LAKLNAFAYNLKLFGENDETLRIARIWNDWLPTTFTKSSLLFAYIEQIIEGLFGFSRDQIAKGAMAAVDAAKRRCRAEWIARAGGWR